MLLNPLRRLGQDPAKLLAPYVTAGMTAVEPGPGMGFFTLELARRVGPEGRVVAIDLQQRMLDALRRRAEKAGVAAQVETRLARGASLGLEDLAGAVDFVLAFAVVHELPDAEAFFTEAHRALKPGGRLLFSEPAGHVTRKDFAGSLELAGSIGFEVVARPAISRSHSAVLLRPSDR